MANNVILEIYRGLRVPDEDWERGKQIASELGETDFVPRAQIARIVHFCGEEFARRMLAQAQEIYNGDGMTVHNGSRKRTLGGIFFYLARGAMPNAQRLTVFPHLAQPEFRNLRHKYIDRPAFAWETRKAVADTLAKSAGKVSDVIVRIVGHPGRFEKRREVVITTMKHEIGYPDLATDMPPLPTEPTIYTVYIPSKHWKKIEPGLKDEKKLLEVEGIGVFDSEIGGIVVYANVARLRKVKEHDEQKSAPKDAEPTTDDSVAPVSASVSTEETEAPTKKPRASKAADTKTSKSKKAAAAEVPAEAAAPAELPPPPEKLEQVIPENAPPEVREKLQELYTAAQQYYDKIMALREQPNVSTFSLNITQKLLNSVEKQIKELLAEHA